MIAAAGNYMSSDAWAAWVVLLLLGFGAVLSVVAWLAGRPAVGPMVAAADNGKPEKKFEVKPEHLVEALDTVLWELEGSVEGDDEAGESDG